MNDFVSFVTVFLLSAIIAGTVSYGLTKRQGPRNTHGEMQKPPNDISVDL